jgi:hypothetical protein
MKLSSALLLLLFYCAAVRQARADGSDFVSRSKGWMILLPPLSRPDHITGEQTILTSAPDKKWTAIVLRGYDGGSYDFADEHTCKLMLKSLAMRLYNGSEETTLKTRHLHLLSTAKCVRDDGRRHVLVQ